MNGGRHAADDGSFARSAGGAATRGIVLILIAVVLGFILLRSGGGSTESVSAGATIAPTSATGSEPAAVSSTTEGTGSSEVTEPTETSAAESTTSTTAEGTTETTAGGEGSTFQTRDPNEVKVQVANTTKTAGAASRISDQLKAKGYNVLTATNYTAGALARTKIHHRQGYFLEAREVATALGLDPDNDVFIMPAAPEASIQQWEDPDVLVLVGSDLASTG